MTVYAFHELGYFSEQAVKRIADRMNGKSWMDIRVTSSNEAGNHTLIVGTKEDVSQEELRELFLHMALNEL